MAAGYKNIVQLMPGDFIYEDRNGDNWVESKDRELQLSYALPKNICQKLACQGLTVSVTGQNLGYIKSCTIPLPNNTTYTNGNTAGWGGTYNVPRTLLFGLNVTF